MTSEAAAAGRENSRPVAESRYAAEARAVGVADFKLIHQDFARGELARRLAAGADPLELALKVARLGFIWGHYEGYGEGHSHATHDMVMAQIRRRRAD